MDQDGFCQFASIKNLAHRARVSESDTADAVKILEAPDKDSSDPDNEGRRVERIPGGWMVLNSEKYREIVTAEFARENNRIRVKRHRAKKQNVTPCNETIITGNASETETYSETQKEEPVGSTMNELPRGAEKSLQGNPKRQRTVPPGRHEVVKAWDEEYPAAYGVALYFWSPKDDKAIDDLLSMVSAQEIMEVARLAWKSQNEFIRSSASDIATLKSQWNKIQASVKSNPKSQIKFR